MLDQPALLGALIGASVAFLAALASLTIGIINWRQSRITYESGVQGRIEGLYDRLLDYRLKHPEVLKLSRLWQPGCITRIYGQNNDEDRSWAIYLGYVELCISYANAVLLAKRRSDVAEMIYKQQHEPLIKLLMTEHFPAMQQLARDGGFVSRSVCDFILEQRRRGWNWEIEFERLDKVPPGISSQAMGQRCTPTPHTD